MVRDISIYLSCLPMILKIWNICITYYLCCLYLLHDLLSLLLVSVAWEDDYYMSLFTTPSSIYLCILNLGCLYKYRKSKSHARGYQGCLLACQNDGSKLILLTD
jgi:hypothetical protein